MSLLMPAPLCLLWTQREWPASNDQPLGNWLGFVLGSGHPSATGGPENGKSGDPAVPYPTTGSVQEGRQPGLAACPDAEGRKEGARCKQPEERLQNNLQTSAQLLARLFFLMYKEKEKAAHRMCVCEMNAVCVRMSHRRIRARKGCADSGLPDS